MKTLFKLAVLFAVAFGMCSPAYAQIEQGYVTPRIFSNTSTGSQNILGAVPLNATPADRTITVTLAVPNYPAPYSKVLIGVFFTWNAASTVTAIYSCSLDGTNFATKTSRGIDAGAGTVSLFADTYTTGGASADFLLELDVRGCRSIKVVFGGAGAGVSDLITIQMTALAGQ